ncbi:His-Xaa-Ser system protein HxsD [Paraburkholderia terricola]|uniref:His-Xaa-Ser system protein HxsD n=1 Tax=Paraburkholderia terricola TaxID=169427 RepID=A0ABU1LXL4_9BURK|nr:His-Xaa-Ser system protein HxsD [Paraburkholderia terricola]MDR6411488.1 His-Xaa-Ser system protein HxsD [Paraburkholderia terricola]MDR6483651.1 His-Xaa-Ser system protein HxsD [Paraburkholderia terricola]
MNIAAETREILFDRQVYAAEAIQKAAYRFVDRMAVNLHVTDTHVRCALFVNPEVGTPDDVIRDFQKEVLDQHLRLKIASETESIRHLILAHAFSRTGLT